VARTERKYGRRAERYVHMEVGHAGQNLLLQATALGLGAVPVGAFNDDQVAKVLALPEGQAPLYLIPVGVPAQR
jgi:SagB-type dehydrogenase family enzyme